MHAPFHLNDPQILGNTYVVTLLYHHILFNTFPFIGVGSSSYSLPFHSHFIIPCPTYNCAIWVSTLIQTPYLLTLYAKLIRQVRLSLQSYLNLHMSLLVLVLSPINVTGLSLFRIGLLAHSWPSCSKKKKKKERLRKPATSTSRDHSSSSVVMLYAC